MQKIKVTNRVLLRFLVKNRVKGKFIKNCQDPKWEYQTETFIHALNDEKCSDVLSHGFSWTNSPEGFEFWSNLDDKYKNYHAKLIYSTNIKLK